jgi:hypothetical protein
MLLYVIVRSVLLYTTKVCNKDSTEGSGRQVDIGDKHVTVISVSDFHSKPGLVLDALLRGSNCVLLTRYGRPIAFMEAVTEDFVREYAEAFGSDENPNNNESSEDRIRSNVTNLEPRR